MSVNKLHLTLTPLLMGLTAFSANATSIDLNATVSFQERGTPQNPLADIFTIENNSSSGAQISQVVIDLSTATVAGAFFDVVNGGVGGNIGGGNGFGVTPGVAGGIATGYAGVLGEFDGSTAITLLFSNFDAGETITVGTDVDHDDGNIADWLLTGTEFAGTSISVTFVGGFTTTTLLGAFENIPGPPPGDATASVSATVVPEPATVALMFSGLLGAGFFRRRS